jgi:helicase
MSVEKSLGTRQREELREIGRKILSSLESRTQQCERLARCIQKGTAFHHAGLTNKQRSLVEEGFKKGSIRLICATPTLAAGLNLPAYRVIVRDLKRFSSYRGMDYLPALEIQQMAGRAGRPMYDKEGEAILIPKNRQEAEYCWRNYIHGEPEKIYSKLGVEPVLRTHVLALIAGGVVSSKKELSEFFSKTFYAFQYRDMTRLKNHLDKIVGMLEGFGFIKSQETSRQEFRPAYFWEDDNYSLEATKTGKRVSELYIDPLQPTF